MARAKLTEQDKIDIRELHASGVPWAAIAAKYKISTQTISRTLDPEKYAKALEQSAQYQKENRQRLHEQNKARTRRYSFVINRERDAKVIEKLDAQDNVSEYLRGLVLDDIERESE